VLQRDVRVVLGLAARLGDRLRVGEHLLQLGPLLARDVAVADDPVDDLAGAAAALEQVDDRQRDLAFAQVARDRLAERAIDALSIFPDGAARRAMTQAAEFAVARGY
jgi:hypothetical protein